jgi:hypothetical protein
MKHLVSRARWLNFGALVAVLVLASPPAIAYPISPVTLWDLVERSELVVLADVTGVRPIPRPPDGGWAWNSDVATLKVVEIWKGSAPTDLEVDYPANMSCPAPPVYDVGHRVLAFLAREDGRWQTVALSYGTRYPETPAEVEAYRSAIVEALVLQDPARPRPLSLASKRQWQLRRAAQPATRWDGLYGLLPASDEDHARYDRSSDKSETLSTEERKILARGFIESPPVDSNLPVMLRALRDEKDPAVTQAAVSAFEAALTARHFPWWAEDTLPLIRERVGKRKPQPPRDSLAQTFKDAATANWDAQARDVEQGVQREWFELKRDFHLVPRPLPHPPDDNRVWAVGGNTSL